MAVTLTMCASRKMQFRLFVADAIVAPLKYVEHFVEEWAGLGGGKVCVAVMASHMWYIFNHWLYD